MILKNLKTIKYKKTFLLISSVVLLLLSSSVVYAASLALRIEEPRTPFNRPFKIGFVALDLEDRPVTAECYKKAPGDSSFVKFGPTFNLGNGGSSGDCNVTSSILNTEGTYDFKVIANAGSDTEESQIVSVSYDATPPGIPKDLEKDKKSSCEYEISFKTANDGGQTAYVEVYRSDDTEFGANASTRVSTITIGSNQSHEFTNTVSGGDCGNTQYYAVRAFDNAGNASDVLAEEVVTIITETTTTTTTTTTTETEEEVSVPGALTVGEPAGVGEGEPLEGEVVTEEPEEEEGEVEEDVDDIGDVLGEQEPEEEDREGGILSSITDNFKNNTWLWLVILLLIPVVGLAARFYFNRNKDI